MSKPDKTPEEIHREACIAFVTYYRIWLITDDARRLFDIAVNQMPVEDIVEKIMQWANSGMVWDINLGRAGIAPFSSKVACLTPTETVNRP